MALNVFFPSDSCKQAVRVQHIPGGLLLSAKKSGFTEVKPLAEFWLAAPAEALADQLPDRVAVKIVFIAKHMRDLLFLITSRRQFLL